jgi:SEC-C motif-containing protein
MKARFAAYAVGDVDFIVETTDPEGPAYEPDEQAWREGIARFSERTDFLKVEVLESERDGSTAYVHFRATLKRDGEDASFAERSRFRRSDGRWLYVSADTLDD